MVALVLFAIHLTSSFFESEVFILKSRKFRTFFLSVSLMLGFLHGAL